MQQGELEYAGFWIRLGATLIDSILILLVTAPFLVSIYGWAYYDRPVSELIAGPADFLISLVFPAVAIILLWHYRQATPGKMAISARVVDARTGGTLSVRQSVGRYFAYIVSTLPLCLGFLWIAFDARKQGWHDKLAGTVVVRKKPAAVEFNRV